MKKYSRSDPEFEELARYYQQIPYPKLRKSLLQLLVLLPHMDRDAVMELIEEYFSLVDLLREHEKGQIESTVNDNKTS